MENCAFTTGLESPPAFSTAAMTGNLTGISMHKVFFSILTISILAGCSKGQPHSALTQNSPPKSSASQSASNSSTEDEPYLSSMTTVGGLLAVRSSSQNQNGQTSFVLNGNTIPDVGQNDMASIVKKFNINGDDVVLINDASIGTCCDSWENDNFLIINKNGSVKVAKQVPINKMDDGGWTSSFMCGEDASRPKRIGDTIQVACTKAEGRQETTYLWTYQNGVVKESRQ